MTPEHGPRRGQAGRGPGIHGTGDLVQSRDRRVLAWWCDTLLGWGLVNVGEADSLHRVEVVQVAPEFLKAVCSRQRRGVVTKMVLTELARGVAKIMQELRQRRSAGS